MNKDKAIIFISYFCAFIILIILIGNLWLFKQMGIDKIDNISIYLITLLIGSLLFPYVQKIKVGYLEIEKMKENIDNLNDFKIINEVIHIPNGGYYYYNVDGKHLLPDGATASFLKSNKGIIILNKNDFDKLPTSYPMDSVLKSKIVDWNGHIFIYIDGKKLHVSSASYLADWKKPGPHPKVNDEEIMNMPTWK